LPFLDEPVHARVRAPSRALDVGIAQGRAADWFLGSALACMPFSQDQGELSVVLVPVHIWPAVPSQVHTSVCHYEAPRRGQSIGMPARSRTHGRAWTLPLASPMLTVGLRPKALPFRPCHSLACLAQSFAIVCVPRVLSPSSPLWPNH
jgi:hypothetical protein